MWYERVDATTLRIYLHTYTPTEFAVIVNAPQPVLVHCPTVRDLGFGVATSRKLIYEHIASEKAYGPLSGFVAVRVMCITRPGDGELHVVSEQQDLSEGKRLYGHVVDWPNGRFRCRVDIAKPEDTLVPETRLALLLRWRK